MKKITHSFGVELDWVESFASHHEGKVEGNFIIVPKLLMTGQTYFLNCGFGISVLFVDVVYHSDIHLRRVHDKDDFVAIYYNLTVGEASTILNNAANDIGQWSNNLSFIDSTLQSDYIVKAGTETFELCIFVKKELIKEYFKNNPSLKDRADDILNPQLNTIAKFTRMSNDSYHLLMNLRTKEVGGPSFDLHLRGAVQCLIADYIEKMTLEEIVIDTINEADLNAILQSQTYLIENIDKFFPGIEVLAQQCRMSPTKYKSLFKKLTGLTPNSFFLNNKLIEAKRLLIDRQFNIMEISNKLSFTSNSYFTVKFKSFFGMSPKDFIKQLP
ncbi:helix-turn-helix transcriptional regulator [Flavobacterium sp. ACN6]|uniref:helix-turn-helix transcriptional regulator n=1 Tax=Flavobacterium sp. ACN6 TaxID=1920426 RepID=UPI000BB2CEE8|nr:AraC family transcriptional regulator [Flavobacterium sp. ACN6]PBJ04600.1 Regulatory protein PchR [Flavobacterium sp. ACN6]